MSGELTRSQALALEYIEGYARGRKEKAAQSIREVMAMSDIDQQTYEEALDSIRRCARVALHFHPDRPGADMRTVAEGLLEQGVYKSQFETALSNGSVSAYPGGERDLWEEKMFGGAYQAQGADNWERPKYGALDLMLHPDGPAPRFGSCYLLLKPGISRRSTFTYLDSHENPEQKGTLVEFDDIMAALLVESFRRDFAIGEKDLTPSRLIRHLREELEKPFQDPARKRASRNLNHYIEAQVHGDISLAEDVDILVADPSFKGTQTGETLERICSRYSIEIYWHMGFALKVEDVPSDFRGPGMPSLARRVAKDGVLNAARIGEAAMDLMQNPDRWKDRGTYPEVLQELKLLWHVLVRCGEEIPQVRRRSGF